jgi:hypothetical protein
MFTLPVWDISAQEILLLLAGNTYALGGFPRIRKIKGILKFQKYSRPGRV